MSERIQNLASGLRQTAEDAQAAFGGLNVDQLNWKPDAKSWSVAQCLEHLIKTHSLYFPILEKLSSGQVEMTSWERTSPLSGFFGRYLTKAMQPENPKKMRTAPKAEPSTSAIGGDIVGRYVEHQDRMAEAIERVPTAIDAKKRIITSPLLAAITYSLDDCYTILLVHSQRHVLQAKRVMDNAGFPHQEKRGEV